MWDHESGGHWGFLVRRNDLTGRSAWLIPRRKTSWPGPGRRQVPPDAMLVERSVRRTARKRKVSRSGVRVTPRATMSCLSVAGSPIL